MIAADLLAALGPVLEALRTLGVRHYVGGSIASSVHGLPRTSEFATRSLAVAHRIPA